MIILQAFAICNTWTVFIPHVHITDLSPGITIGNMDTTGLRWLSSFFNTPADEKDKCDEHHPLINWSQSECLSVIGEFRIIMNGQLHAWRVSYGTPASFLSSPPHWLGHVNDTWIKPLSILTRNVVLIGGRFQEEKKRKGKEKVNTPVLKVGGLKMISLSPTEILEKLCIIEDSRKSHTTSDPSSCKFHRVVSTRLYCCLLVNVNPQVE